MARIDQRVLHGLPDDVVGPGSMSNLRQTPDAFPSISFEELLREDAPGERAPSNERLLINDLMRRMKRVENIVTVTYEGSVTHEREDGATRLADLLATVHETAVEAQDTEDLGERLYAVVKLKRLVQEAIELAHEHGPRDLKHALVMLRDGLSNTYSEDLTSRQLDGLVAATARLMEGVEDLDASMEVSRLLTSHDLDYIPDLPDSDD